MNCLANTGFEPVGFVVIAALALVAGVVIWMVARRRGRMGAGVLGLVLLLAVGGSVLSLGSAAPAQAADCPTTAVPATAQSAAPTSSPTSAPTAEPTVPPTTAPPTTPPTGTPDLTPQLTLTPTTVVGNGNTIQGRVQINEIDGTSTLAAPPIYLQIPVSSHFTITFDPAQTTSAGSAVQNSNWTFLGTSGGNYIWKYSGSSLIGAAGTSSFGFSMIYSANGQSGTENVVASIFDGGGGETNFVNNKSGQSISYSVIG